jgi:hypothetical protein
VTQLVAAKYETRWFKFQFQQDADHAGFDHTVNIGLRNGLNPKISPDQFCHTICNVQHQTFHYMKGLMKGAASNSCKTRKIVAAA